MEMPEGFAGSVNPNVAEVATEPWLHAHSHVGISIIKRQQHHASGVASDLA